MKYRVLFIVFVLLYLLPGSVAGQQYNIVRQGVCWTTPGAVDSSLTRLVYVSVSGAGPTSVKYVNAAGADVDVSGGGSFEMGYCGCCADSTAINLLYYSFGDSIVNGDTLISPFNSGNIFYVSTNGDNATGRKGYMDLPFLFSPMDSTGNSIENSTIWVYPGLYDVGPGQTIPYTFGNRQNPYVFYAPNADLNFINNTNGYLFRPSGAHTNGYFYFIANKVYLQDLSFVRFFEVGNIGGFFANINQLILQDSITGGDAAFVIPSGIINIDSFNVGSRTGIYTTSLTGDWLQYNIGTIESIQTATIDGAKSEVIRQGNSFAGTQDSTFLGIEIQTAKITDAARLFSNTHAGQYQNTNLVFNIENSFIGYTGTSTDTLLTEVSPGSTTTNNLNYISLADAGYGNYNANLNFEYIESDKFINVGDNGPNADIKIDVGEAVFKNTRGVQLQNFDPVGSKASINCENCLSEANAVVLVFGANGEIEISGKYETAKSGKPVIYAEKDIFIGNAQLINDGVTPAIIAPTPITVYVRGDLYMNSDSIDSNVTFQKIEYGYENCAGSFEDTQSFLSSFCPPAYNGTAFATTDGSGDITVTIGTTMPDATYTALLGAQGSTFQQPQVQSQTATDFVVRFFDAAGNPITSTGVVLDWEVRDR